MMADETILNNKGKIIITRIRNRIISILIDGKGSAVHISVSEDNDDNPVGNIYIGRMANIAPSMKAAFVDCPGKMTGYLKIRDNMPVNLHPGNRILVQVSNESIKGKNPSLSAQISLTGKYSILRTNDSGISFSSKFSDAEKRKRLLSIYNSISFDDSGFIIRTNSLYAPEERIIDEIKRLHNKWDSIRQLSGEKVGISEIYRSPSAYLQDIRDTYEDLFTDIITDDKDIYSAINDFLEEYQPEDLTKLKYYSGNGLPLMSAYNIKKQLHKALDARVWLNSGAYILIEPTQALTAIDVNTGKYISNKDPEKEFLKINQEAAAEIARQIRLRNLSGIIIIDFINMKSIENKKLLLEYLKSQLKFDPVKTNIIEMTKLDLVEITRAKIRKPIYEILSISMLQ